MPKTKAKEIKVKIPAKAGKPKEKKPAKEKKSSYFGAIGRRKTSVARVRLSGQEGKEILINGKRLEEYFPTFELKQIVLSPLDMAECLDKFKVAVKVKGGGYNSQAEAVRHGIARALVLLNPEFRKILKKAGFLTRDPRMRERKKFGLRRARRAPQWQKR